MGYSRGVSRLQRMRIAMFTSAACSENGYKRWALPMGNLIALTLLAEAKQGRDWIDRWETTPSAVQAVDTDYSS